MARAVDAARQAFDHGPWPRLTHARAGRVPAGDRRRAAEAGPRTWARSGPASPASSTPSPRRPSPGHGGRPSTTTPAWPTRSPSRRRRSPPWVASSACSSASPSAWSGAIIPWNAPLSLITYKIAPALLAGCTVVLKSSPEAPGEAYLVAEVAEDDRPAARRPQRGHRRPRGLRAVWSATRDVDKITFTGSTAAGRRIASLCGERIARCTLELGGKSAAVILDDMDLPTAAACPRPSRVLPDRPGLLVADPDRRQPEPPRRARRRAGRHLLPGQGGRPLRRRRPRWDRWSPSASATGSRATSPRASPRGPRWPPAAAGPKHLDRGWFVEPTVFGNVDNSSTIAQEEIFGPVLSVIPANNEEHAVAIANDTIYGLNASVFTNDVDRAREVARQLRSGTVGHNAFRTDFGIAFGGFKQSGIGREGGTEGLLPFLETKTVILSGEPSSSS